MLTIGETGWREYGNSVLSLKLFRKSKIVLKLKAYLKKKQTLLQASKEKNDM